MSFDTPNIITLGSLQYITDGQVLVQNANNFAEGLRQGNADYADVSNVFFKIFDDFRGGIGTHYGRDREDIDKMYESYGVRTWINDKGISLAPSLTEVTLAGAAVSYNYNDIAFEESIVAGINYLWLGVGNTVLRNNTGWVVDSPSPKPAANITYALYDWTNTSGSRYLYWAPGFINTSTLALTDVDFYRRDVGIAVGSSSAWAQPAAGEKAHDFLDFDKKLLKIYYGQVKSSLDGITWTDLSMNIQGVPNQFATHRSKFVGLAYNAMGELAPYCIRAGRLFVLDTFTQTYAEIEVGLNILVDGCVFGDEVAVTDNHSIKLYHPQRPVRDIGLPSFKDPYKTFTNGARPAFLKLEGFGPYLLAYVNMAGASTYFQLWLYNNSGWHPINIETLGSIDNIVNGGHAIGKWKGNNVLTVGNQVWVVSIDGTAASNIHTHQIQTAEVLLGNDSLPVRASSGRIITPWFKGGFPSMKGTLIELMLYFSTEWTVDNTDTLLVEYQLDGNETTWLTTALENAGSVAMTLSNTGFPVQRIGFGTSGNERKDGLSFQSVRFRFTFTRSSTVTTSPVLIAYELKYLKKPTLVTRYRLTIDTQKTADFRRGTSSEVTSESILREIYSLIDDNPLTPFSYTREGQGESIGNNFTDKKYVTIIGETRRDVLAPNTEDKYSLITIDLLDFPADFRKPG